MYYKLNIYNASYNTLFRLSSENTDSFGNVVLYPVPFSDDLTISLTETENRNNEIQIMDAWAFKISATGVLQWQHCYGGSNNDYFSSVAGASDGGYIFAGGAESFDFDVIGNHYDDIWVVKTDTMGNILWQKCLGGSDSEYGKSRIGQTTDNGFIVAGQAYSNDGDVSGNHGMQDCWFVKLAADTILSTENQIPDRMEVQVYPNPAREYVRIKLPSSSDVVLVIKDITGKQVYEQKHYHKKEWRETLHLSSGVYIMQFNFGTKTITQKLMVR